MDRQEVPLRTVCPNCSTLWRLTSDNTVEMFRVCSGCHRSMLPRKAGDSPYVHEIIELAKTQGLIWALSIAIVMVALAGMILLAQFQR